MGINMEPFTYKFLNGSKEVSLTPDQIETRLKGLAQLKGREIAWIRSDLSTSKSNRLTRFFWHFIAKHFEWIRKSFYKIDFTATNFMLFQLNRKFEYNTKIKKLIEDAEKNLSKILPNPLNAMNTFMEKDERNAAKLLEPVIMSGFNKKLSKKRLKQAAFTILKATKPDSIKKITDINAKILNKTTDKLFNYATYLSLFFMNNGLVVDKIEFMTELMDEQGREITELKIKQSEDFTIDQLKEQLKLCPNLTSIVLEDIRDPLWIDEIIKHKKIESIAIRTGNSKKPTVEELKKIKFEKLLTLPKLKHLNLGIQTNQEAKSETEKKEKPYQDILNNANKLESLSINGTYNAIENCKNLKKLEITDSFDDKTFDEIQKNLVGLEHLSLPGKPAETNNLKQLKTFSFNAKGEEISDTFFDPLVNLEKLNIKCCALNDLPSSLTKLNKLKELHLPTWIDTPEDRESNGTLKELIKKGCKVYDW